MIGVAHFSAIDLPPADFVSAAARAGFGAVGLRMFPAFPGAPCYELPHGSRAAAEVAARLAGEGLSLYDVEFVVIDAAFDAEATRTVLEHAAALGAVRVNCCGDDPDRSRFADNLAAFAAIAADCGMAVDLENMGWRVVRSFDDAATIARGIANCGVLVDALHFFRNGGTPAALNEAPAGLVRSLQLCDVRGPEPSTNELRVAEARSGRFAPGEGDLPLAALIAAAPADVVLSVEVPLAEGEDAGGHLSRLYAAAQRVRATVRHSSR